MIKVNANEGELHISGPFDDILAEYTLLTKTMLKQLNEMTNEEKAFKTLAALGQLAAEGFDKTLDAQKLYKGVEKIITDELQI